MKIVRFNGGRIGIVRGDEITDVTELVAGDAQFAWPPVGVLRLIRAFATIADAAEPSAKRLALADAHLEAPIVWPHNLFALPVNYAAHGQEMKSVNRSDLNGFFLKTTSSISGPNDPIVLPDLPGREIHHECELGVIIGPGGRNIARDNALDHVFGYTCLVDVVVRGKEERVMRKSYDSFCPIGPWIVTKEEVPNPQALQMKLWINGEIRQDANTRDMIVDIPGMIEMISRVTTLEPGDVIATGTPEGVGPIVRGDSLRIAIEHVGEMTVPVR